MGQDIGSRAAGGSRKVFVPSKSSVCRVFTGAAPGEREAGGERELRPPNSRPCGCGRGGTRSRRAGAELPRAAPAGRALGAGRGSSERRGMEAPVPPLCPQPAPAAPSPPRAPRGTPRAEPALLPAAGQPKKPCLVGSPSSGLPCAKAGSALCPPCTAREASNDGGFRGRAAVGHPFLKVCLLSACY